MVPINWLSNEPKLFNFERPYSRAIETALYGVILGSIKNAINIPLIIQI